MCSVVTYIFILHIHLCPSVQQQTNNFSTTIFSSISESCSTSLIIQHMRHTIQIHPRKHTMHILYECLCMTPTLRLAFTRAPQLRRRRTLSVSPLSAASITLKHVPISKRGSYVLSMRTRLEQTKVAWDQGRPGNLLNVVRRSKQKDSEP